MEDGMELPCPWNRHVFSSPEALRNSPFGFYGGFVSGHADYIIGYGDQINSTLSPSLLNRD